MALGNTRIPLSAVLALIENQNAFNRELIEKLGLHLENASIHYKNALNPPMDTGTGKEMSYSSPTEEEDDYQYQLDVGLISPGELPPQMRRILGDTDITVE